jgi:hypothetical protein
MNKGKIVLLTLCSLFFVVPFLCAQVPTGRILGTVSDEEGIPLPGVAVEATSPRLVGKASALTDSNGDYRLFALTPGTYKVTFTLQGFKGVTREGIVVQIEQTVKLDITLHLGSIEEEVTVVGQSPLIDVKSTVKGMTMTKMVFEVLPRGRDFDSLVSAVPGVNTEPLLAGISVDGASGLENMYYIDGTDISNMMTGARGQGAVFEFIDEVQVKASGYEAEFGGAMGGVVNVITRQGGNEFHGEVIGYYSGSALTGKERDVLYWDPYDVYKVSYVNNQDLYGKEKIDRIEAGFSLGGYILKDRLWFFGSVLPVLLSTTRHVLFEPSGIEGDYPQKYKYYNYQAKLTAQPFRFLRLGASYVNNFSKYKGALPNRDGTSNPDDVWPDYGYSYPNWSASGYADFTFGNNLLIGLRGGSFYTNTKDQLVQPDGPRWYHSGEGPSAFPDIPEDYIRPRGWSNYRTVMVYERNVRQRTHVDADVTFYLNLAGEHAWKFGISWVRSMEDKSYTFKYPSCPFIPIYWNRPAILFGVNYGRGEYGYYAVRGNQLTGPVGHFWKAHNDRWALYLQDSWTIGEKLTLNAGVRAENEYVPNYSDDPALEGIRPIDFQFKDKLAPRLGVIYDLFGDSSLKVFGSYGLYFDVFRLYSAGIVYGGNKNKTAYYTLDTYEWDKIGVGGYYPGTFLAVIDYAARSGDFGVDPDLKPMSQREFSLGLEKRLMENLSATVRVVQKHLRYAIEDVGVLDPAVGELYYTCNPGYGVTRWTTNGGRFDPAYPETPKAKREYWAVNFSLDKRFSGNWLAGFSYTWSRLTGNYSGLASSDEWGRASPYVERSFDLWHMAYDKEMNLQDGPLSTDRTHYFKLFGAYTFPFRLTVGAVVSAMSGIPFSERWYVLGDYTWRPFNRGYYREGISGNDLKQIRTPFLWFANLYAEYSLRLGKTTLNFNINVDNLFNIKTAQDISDMRTYWDLNVSEEKLRSGNWDLDDPEIGYIPDPAFMMKYQFYPPIAARLGIRFSF